jgi:D-glycero-D-manno-heptose 1,7-bisphosphate phosphatase
MGVRALKPAVFFDRDGTLNQAVVREGKPYPPGTADAVEIVAGAEDAVTELRDRGFLLVVVTNQPDVARGSQTRENVEAINARIGEKLGLSDFRVCWHDNADHCPCRKPKPGLILDAAEELSIDLGASFVVGDRWSDIAAGAAAGCRTVLIEFGYHEKPCPVEPDWRATSLRKAVDWILEQPSFPEPT